MCLLFRRMSRELSGYDQFADTQGRWFAGIPPPPPPHVPHLWRDKAVRPTRHRSRVSRPVRRGSVRTGESPSRHSFGRLTGVWQGARGFLECAHTTRAPDRAKPHRQTETITAWVRARWACGAQVAGRTLGCARYLGERRDHRSRTSPERHAMRTTPLETIAE